MMKKAFTLIEVMVSAAIISVVLVLLTKFIGQRSDNAALTKIRTTIRNIATQVIDEYANRPYSFSHIQISSGEQIYWSKCFDLNGVPLTDYFISSDTVNRDMCENVLKQNNNGIGSYIEMSISFNPINDSQDGFNGQPAINFNFTAKKGKIELDRPYNQRILVSRKLYGFSS